MALVVLSIDEKKLPPHTREEFEEWVSFCVGDRNEMRNANPLIESDLQSRVREISWSDDHFRGATKMVAP